MPGWIKLTTGLVVALLSIALSAAALAPRWIDQQQLIRDLEADLSLSLGRPTRIESISRLQLLPTPRVHFEGIQVVEAVADGSPILATAEAVQLEAAIWPLIMGRVVLAEVLVERLKVRLPWASGAQPAAMNRVVPHAARHRHALAKQDHYSLPPALGVGFAAGAAAAQPAAANTRLAAATQLQESAGSEQLEPSAAPTLANPPTLPPIRRLIIRDGELIGPAPTTAAGPMLGLSRLSLTAGPITPGHVGRLDATFTVHLGQSGWSMPGLAEAKIALADPLTEVALRPLRLRFGSSAGGQGPPIEIDAEALIDLMTARVSIDPFELIADQLRVAGAAALFSTPSGLGLDGQARVPSFDLRSWFARQTALAMPGSENSLRKVGGQFDIRLRGSAAAIDNAALLIDGARMRGVARLRLPQTLGASVSGRLAMAIDRLDLDPYLVAAGAIPASDAAVNAGPSALPPVPPLPSEADPTEPGLRLDLAAGELRLGGLGFSTVQLYGRLLPHALELDSRADFYGGWLHAQFAASRLDAAAGDPQASLEHQAEPDSQVAKSRLSGPDLRLDATAGGVDVAALLTHLQLGAHRQAPPLTGLAEIELDLFARGADTVSIASTLGGEVVFAVRDGTVTMVDLGQLITGTIEAIGVSREDAENLTRFSALSLSAEGAQGRFESQDIRLRSNLLEVDGVGQLDLPTQEIALDLEAVLTKPPKGRGIKELEGIPVPISAQGPWFDPRWEVDTRAALDAAARRALREDSGLFDTLEERTGIQGLGDGLRQILPGLLGR